LAQGAQHFEAVATGEAEIEDDQVELSASASAWEGSSVTAVLWPWPCMAALEGVGDGRFVFDYKDAAHPGLRASS
jgi:hypothetical protein